LGQIFTWDNIASKEIPEPTNFLTLLSEIRRELTQHHAVVGAVICGSVIWQTHNRRSDLDIIVVYNPAQQKEAFTLFTDLNRRAKKLYIPLELMPIDANFVTTKFHHIGSLFGKHLTLVAQHGAIIKTEPKFSFAHETLSDDFDSYIRNKFRVFDKKMPKLPLMKDEYLCDFLKDILEVPIAVARKRLQLLRTDLKDDSKKSVITEYQTIASTEEYELLCNILRIDRAYSEHLELQLKSPDEIKYQAQLDAIAATAIQTLTFLKLTAHALNK
jgi:predicted nucleotidyltransferase